MGTDTLLVFVILAATVALFVSDRLRLDLVALMSLLALLLTGILTPAQALAGFADPLVLMIAGLFVVSTGLFQTGIAARLGRWLGRVAGTSEVRLIALVMVVTAVLSGFMSSTGTVAVMLPVVVSLAWRARISPSKLLIPLTMASLLGGMMTLIGTPPNLVASNQLVAQGMPGFGFFAFTPLGFAMLLIGLVFMVTIGRHWLPSRAPSTPGGDTEGQLSLAELSAQYELPTRVFRSTLPDDSPLAGRTLQELGWPERHQVQVLAIDTEPDAVRSHRRSRRHLERSKSIGPATVLEPGDRLLLQGQRASVDEIAAAYALSVEPVDPNAEGVVPRNLGFVEVLPTPRSRWLNQTLAELHFRDRFGVQVVAVRRDGATITEGLARLTIRFGDTLLVEGPRKAFELLRRERLDAVVLADPGALEAEAPRAERAPIALAIMIVMLVVMTFAWVPNVVAVGVAAVLMVLTGCLTMDDAYRGINWEAVVLIAAILPMATALEITGGLQLAVDALVAGLGPLGPLAMLAGLFVLTSVASQVISNTATAVLLAPIAFQAALLLDVSPYPLLMTVALAASTAFATPVASPVNTLVLGPGQYRFGDFLRVGVVLQLLVLAATVVLVPILLPF
ncbi:MAG: SLC13 family permease [Trueperaceae bacterium]|nr:MAG: SLC13 family permease [Trueperaceae bacterium]